MRARVRTSLGYGLLLFWRSCTCCIAFIGDRDDDHPVSAA